jgi:prolipoprotein diacylglyceryl transferase
MAMALPAHIPSPSINSFSIGPLVVHFYALAYLVGIAVAIIITRRRWRAVGGDPDIVGDIALWSVPAGIIGGRIYFDITTPMDIPHVWYGVFAVWDGGLGIWGGIALATVVGLWRLRRHGVNAAQFMDAVAPALLVAQGIGRIGNYFNKELFGRPTSLPWGLEIPFQYRVAGGIPTKYLNAATFQPTFLYELIFDFAWAAVLVWLGHHRRIKPPGLFALYVFGYSAYRIFEESLRIDSSVYFLGLRLNTYIASALALIGLFWFLRSQRRPDPVESPDPDPSAAAADPAANADTTAPAADTTAPAADTTAPAADAEHADADAEHADADAEHADADAEHADADAEHADAANHTSSGSHSSPGGHTDHSSHSDHTDLENSGSELSDSENSESENSESVKSASSSQAASES